MDVQRFHIQDLPSERLRAEASALVEALQACLPGSAEIFEVGSTAVPGVVGKGDIDVLVRAPEVDFDAVRAQLDARYPRNPRQLSNEVYQGYTVPSDLDVAIQLTVTGGPFDFFLTFLDALRADPRLVETYNALKRRWHGEPMDDYRAAKARFIEAVLRAEAPRQP